MQSAKPRDDEAFERNAFDRPFRILIIHLKESVHVTV